jgi:predicted TIM-barrel fold metal-dependent hydrolase
VIVDCHCHAGTGDGLRGPWDTEARIEPHLERAHRAGIDVTVVFPVFNTDYAAANARLARIVARYPQELIGFASLHPARDAGRVGTLVGKAVEQYGFHGLKVHGRDALPTREVCEVARRYHLPVLVDIVGRVSVLEMLASQYPDVDFIIPHLGTFADNWTTHLHVIDQVCRFPNVYTDTSGVRYWDLLVRAVRRAGPGKILFGSDGPLLHPAVELYKIKLLRLPPAQESLITGGNILRLLASPHHPSGSQPQPAPSPARAFRRRTLVPPTWSGGIAGSINSRNPSAGWLPAAGGSFTT